jgi:tetrahydrodipicolinate N-succinyltransferase
LKKGCSIGANTTIISGHVIGEYAFIGAGTVVTKDIRYNKFRKKKTGLQSFDRIKLTKPFYQGDHKPCQRRLYSLTKRQSRAN